MSNNDAVRRTWNDEEFEKKAQERRQAERDAGEERRRKVSKVEERVNGDDPFAPTRAWLQPSESGLIDFDRRVGKTEVVAEARDKKSGFYCQVCKTLLKDSNAYLSHMNSKLHQQSLGMSMRTKRSTYEEVQQMFDKLSRAKRGLPEQEPNESVAGDQNARNKSEHAEQSPPSADEPVNEELMAAQAMGLPVGFSSSKK